MSNWDNAWLLHYGEPIQLNKLNSFDDFTPTGYTDIYINNTIEGILYVGCSDCDGYIMSDQTYLDLLKHHGINKPPKNGEWYWGTYTTVKKHDKINS